MWYNTFHKENRSYEPELGEVRMEKYTDTLTGTDGTERTIDPAFGQRIRKAREEMNLRVRDVSDKVGCSPAHLTRLELARRRITSPKILRSLSEVLCIPYDELCTLAGPDFEPTGGALIKQAFPSIRSDDQANAISEFAALITASDLTSLQFARLLEQCEAYVLYCERKNADASEDESE